MILQRAASCLPFDRSFGQQLQEVYGQGRTPPKAATPSNESIFVWQTASCSLAYPGWEGQQVKLIEDGREADHARLDEKSLSNGRTIKKENKSCQQKKTRLSLVGISRSS
jgi:hypothetical protein